MKFLILVLLKVFIFYESFSRFDTVMKRQCTWGGEVEALDAGICFSSRPRQTFSNSQPEQELPFKEIAYILRCPENTAVTRTRRGLQQLRTRLEEDAS